MRLRIKSLKITKNSIQNLSSTKGKQQQTKAQHNEN